MKGKSILLLVFGFLFISCAGMKQADQFYRKGKYDEAISACQAALKTNPQNYRALVIMGRSYYMKKEYPQAIRVLDRAYRLNPTDEVKLELGTACLTARYLDKARECFEEMTPFSRRNEVVIEKLREIDKLQQFAEKSFRKGEKRFRKGDYQTAITFYERTLDKKADHTGAKYKKLVAEGLIQYQRGGQKSLWKAIEAFGKAAAVMPDRGDVHYWLGLAYMKKDRYDFKNPIDEFQQALNLGLDKKMIKAAKKELKAIKKRKAKMDDFWGR